MDRDATPGVAPAVALGVAVVIVGLLVCAAHWPALSAKALSFDDTQYLLENYRVQKPSWESARGFLVEVTRPSTVSGYYQPLAMISLMLDCAMGGRPDDLRAFHRTSLGLHVANTGLIIILLYMLLGYIRKPDRRDGGPGRGAETGRIVVAAAVGLLFGLHPLTIEPIPWVGERKTLLAAFFGLWCLIFYVRYARTRGWGMYAACLVAYVLALMSKPTSTPLPAMMLLLDFWPLGRLSRRSVLEKIPFFAVGGVSAVITFISQATTASVVMPGRYSPWRIPLVLCHNIVFYLYKIVWPAKLSSHYPFPQPLGPSNGMVLAGVIGTFMLITALALSLRRTRALATGWLIFFVMILPTMQVIGFSKVIASDKFVYLPSVGLLLILAWAISRLWDAAAGAGLARAATAGTLGIVAILAIAEAWATRYALRPWQDSVSLYTHMIALTPQAPSLHFGLGAYLARHGRLPGACKEFRKSLELDPNQSETQSNLGGVLVALGKSEEAIPHLEAALRLDPNQFAIRNNLAMALAAQGRDDEAIGQLTEAIRLKPEAVRAHYNLGDALSRRGRYAEALVQYKEAVRIKPDFAEAYSHAGDALAATGKGTEAVECYRTALRLLPAYAEAHSNLAAELISQDKPEEAVEHAREAVRIAPDFAKAHYNLAVALAKQEKKQEAIAELRTTIRLNPDLAEAYNNLGALMQGLAKSDEAISFFSDAVRHKPNYADAHFNLGFAMELRGRFDEAVEHYHEALRLDPQNAEVRERLNVALEKQAAAAK